MNLMEPSETDCSCIPPPPSFDLPPPPKPDNLQWVSDEDHGPMESCPLYYSDATVTSFVQDLGSGSTITQPLFNLMIMAAALVLLLLFGAFSVIWCRKRNRCLLNTKSKPQMRVKEKLLSNSVSIDHQRNGTTNNLNQVYNNIHTNCRNRNSLLNESSQNNQTCQQLLISDNKQRVSIYDTLNPVYEEISLENLADVKKTKIWSPSTDKNKNETDKLLNNEPSNSSDKKLCVRKCENCIRLATLSQNYQVGDNGCVNYDNGVVCRCSFISLPNDDVQLYRTIHNDKPLSEEYRRTAYV